MERFALCRLWQSNILLRCVRPSPGRLCSTLPPQLISNQHHRSQLPQLSLQKLITLQQLNSQCRLRRSSSWLSR